MTVGAAVQISTSESIDHEGHQVYTSIYRVLSDTPTESPITVRSAAGIPSYVAPYSWGGVTNPYAFRVGLRTDRVDTDGTHLKWYVTVTHSTRAISRNGSQNASGLVEDPVAEEWRISGSYVQSTRLAQKDKDGAALQNSAHQPKAIEVPDGYDTLRLSGPSATISLSTRAQAINKVNSGTIWGLTSRQLFLAQWQYQIVSNGTTRYVQNDLEFWIKYAGWNEVFLDEGTREYLGPINVDPEKNYRDIITSSDGPQSTWLLDGNGNVLASGGTPFVFTKSVIDEFNFSTLGFPDPLPGPFV